MPAPIFIEMNAFTPDGGEFGPELSLVQNYLPQHRGWISLRKKQVVAAVADGPMTGAYVHIYQQATQVQEASPSSDVQVGGWVAIGGSGATLYTKVDEATPEDSDYIAALGAPNQVLPTGSAILGYPALVDPTSSADHYIRWRYRIPSTTGVWTVTLDWCDTTTAISSITRVGATATATTSAAHGWSTGQVVIHAGMTQTEYNGRFTITVTGANTYTFTVTGTPATPATGATKTARAVWGSDVATGTGVVSAWTQREKLLTAGEANAILAASYGRFQVLLTAVVAGAVQIARPDGDSALGGWTNQAGSGTNVYQAIDEAVADDADYAKSPVLTQGGASALYRVTLSDLTDPLTDAGFTWNYRIRGSNAGVQIIARLKQGSTTIKTQTHTNVATTYAAQALGLTSGEMANVTDFAALTAEWEASWPSATTATVFQESAPIADDDTGWTPSSGVSCFAMIDEAVRDDSDNISGSILAIRFTMATLNDPGTDADHSLKIVAKTLNTGEQLIVRLISNDTIVRFWDFGGGVGLGPLTSTYTLYTLTLTTGEASLLNYSDVEIGLEAYGAGSPSDIVVSWLRFFAPQRRWAEVSFNELQSPSPARAEMSWERIQIPDVGQVYRGDIPTIFCGSKTKLYEVTESGFTDRSKGGGYGTGAKPGAWRFCSFGNDTIATNRADAVQYRVNNAGAFADLITSTQKPKARFVAAVRNHVVLADINLTNYFPDQVWWSAFDNARTFDDQAVTVSPETQSDQQRIVSRPGQIMGLVGGDYGVLFKRNSMHLMGWVGQDVVFRFDDISASVGTPYPSSIVQTPFGLFFCDGATFRRYLGDRGENTIQDIGTGILSQYLTDAVFSAGGAIAQVSPSDIAIEDQILVGYYDPYARLVFWIYQTHAWTDEDGGPHAQSSDYRHQRGLVYNPAEDRWGAFYDVNLDGAFLTGKPNVTNADTFLLKGGIGFDWDGINTHWFRFASATTYEGTFTSKRQALGIEGAEDGSKAPQAARVTGVMPIFAHVPGGSAPPNLSVTVTTSNDPWFYSDVRQKSTDVTKASAAHGILPVDITGTWFKFSVTIPELSAQGGHAFKGLYVFWELAGQPGSI